MPRPKFKYDTRLKEAELNLFKDLIGKSISGFQLENASILLPPDFHVSNTGKCTIHFYSKETGPFSAIELTSLFQETPPVVDSGGIAITKIYESENLSRTSMNSGLKQDRNSTTSIGYPEESVIESFKFFGSKERRELTEFDPDSDLEFLNTLGFKAFPELEVDTIEFMAIEHRNGKKTIISTDSGGFWYNFLTDKPIDDKMLNDSYMKVNGYEKNIILHHEVK